MRRLIPDRGDMISGRPAGAARPSGVDQRATGDREQGVPPAEKEYWFRQFWPGWFEVIHWKGWAAALAFVPIAAAGMGLETWLKQVGSVPLYYAVMIPFGLLVLAGAWHVTGKIDRRRRRVEKPARPAMRARTIPTARY